MIAQSPEDRTGRGVIQRTISVSWSQARAFHGDKLKLCVRTADVTDGGKVRIEVLTEDTALTLDTFDDLPVAQGKIDHDYTLAWKDKGLRPGDRRFVLRATLMGDDVPKNIVSALSPVLWVDLGPPSLSL